MFSQPAINLSIRISVIMAHRSQVCEVFHLYVLLYEALSPSAATGESELAKFGNMLQRERKY